MKYLHPCVSPGCEQFGKMVEREFPQFPPKGQKWSIMNLTLGPPPEKPLGYKDPRRRLVK